MNFLNFSLVQCMIKCVLSHFWNLMADEHYVQRFGQKKSSLLMKVFYVELFGEY